MTSTPKAQNRGNTSDTSASSKLLGAVTSFQSPRTANAPASNTPTDNKEKKSMHAVITSQMTPDSIPAEAKRISTELDKIYADSKEILFVDESYDFDANGNFYYVLGAVTIKQESLMDLRKKVADNFGDWYHANGKDRSNIFIDRDKKKTENAKMLQIIREAVERGQAQVFASIDTKITQGQSHPNRDECARSARDRCIKKLLPAVSDTLMTSLYVLFEEVKGHKSQKSRCRCDNCLDRSLIKRLNQSRDNSRKIRYKHISPAGEHLLWIPDAIAHITFRHHARRDLEDSQLYEIIEGFSRVLDTD